MRRLLLLPVLVLLVLLTPDLATAAESAPAGAHGRVYSWPVAGPPVLDRGYDLPRTAWGAGHRGVDLRALLGAPVLAAGSGRIAYAGLLAGRGVVVVVHGDGLRTTYEPVAATAHVGDLVTRGDLLGTLGGGHASCRPGTTCLHWGLLRGDTYLDPLSLLGLGRLRLLPLHPATTGAAPAQVPATPGLSVLGRVAVPLARRGSSASAGVGMRSGSTLLAPATPGAPNGVAGRLRRLGAAPPAGLAAALASAVAAWSFAHRHRG